MDAHRCGVEFESGLNNFTRAAGLRPHARIAEMQETIVAMTQLNRDISDFLGVLQAHMAKSH
jgi:hypothetical protein